MVQSPPKPLTFDEFLEWYPEDGRYELIDGTVVEMLPIGPHGQVSGFIIARLILQIEQLKLPYFIPNLCLVKPPDSASGYHPDIIVLDKQTIKTEPLWKKQSTITMGASVRLVIEVVSTNWRNDYLKKLADYEAMGIPEYWIADYLALGATRDIGSPKRPTVSVYQLVDGEYQLNQFRGNQRIESKVFSELNLTVDQLIEAATEEITTEE